jgi:hypothetical protein
MVIEVPRDGGCTIACFTTKLAFPYVSHVFLLLQVPHSTSTEDMPSGGARSSKRVTSPPNERLAEDIPTEGATKAKRARQRSTNERPCGVNTRSSTRQPTETVDQEYPPVAEEDNGLHSPREYEHDWSYDGDYDNDGLSGEHEEHLEGQQDELHEQQTQTDHGGKCHLH